MNNKISLKIAWLFIVIFLLYVSFVVFLLSPKINYFILNSLIFAFVVFLVITAFVIIKIIAPINQFETNKKTFDEQVCIKTKEIENKLYFDELTNLKNRYALEEEIKENDFVSITLIDIDSFDDINELYGFSTGNLVLIKVGKILNEFSLKFDV